MCDLNPKGVCRQCVYCYEFIPLPNIAKDLDR